jgi:gamma-glutamylcyclotransferase (GGCT)/AIG2-like uncharacterized protein YtfP
MPEKWPGSKPLDRPTPSGLCGDTPVRHLFAYGTLLGDRRPAGIARAAERLAAFGPATVRGRLYDLGEYPGLVLDPAASEVHGTVFTVPDDAVLAALDAYEGFEPDDPARSLFVRTRVAATVPDGRALDCFVYVYNRDPAGAPVIASGRYRESTK